MNRKKSAAAGGGNTSASLFCADDYIRHLSAILICPAIPQSSLPLFHIFPPDTARAGAAAVDMEAAKPVIPVRMN